jgi:hypothetical protein
MMKKLITLGLLSVSALSFAQHKFSIMPSVGYAWRVAAMPKGVSNDERNYIKGLKSGLNFDVSAYYHVRNAGIGLKYSNYSASSSGRLSAADQNGNIVSANVSTQDHITFFGPALMYSNYNEETRHKLFMDFGIGAITYKTVTGPITGKGTNLGLEANFGYQYAVTNNILIGPKLGFTAGTLSKMTYNGQTIEFGEDQKEGLTRVSLSAAVTFRF